MSEPTVYTNGKVVVAEQTDKWLVERYDGLAATIKGAKKPSVDDLKKMVEVANELGSRGYSVATGRAVKVRI